MPALILSSRYTTDSQILRLAAQELGWETLRLDGEQIPEWFDSSDGQIALFYTPPRAFDVAAQLSRTLLGCNLEWVIGLPDVLLRRQIRQMTLAEAMMLPGSAFVKHAISKAFPAGIHDSARLANVAANVPRDSLVHVAEPVAWSVEYRCFIANRKVAALSPYRRHRQIIDDHANRLGASQDEENAARNFALSVVQDSSITCPPAFVLDVGTIVNRGWAVVEVNECWASGIYSCDPAAVLSVLLAACVPTDRVTGDANRWNFQSHYARACGGPAPTLAPPREAES